MGKGETEDWLASVSGGSAWKQLQREDQTLAHPRKAAQRGPSSHRKQASPLTLQIWERGKCQDWG